MERNGAGIRRPATMKDIAEDVGVSKMAVSAVLSGTTTRVSVSDATRARIEDAARRFQYRPNNIARALSSRRTHILGFYSGYHFLDTRNSFYAEMVGGLQEACGQRHKDLLLHTVFQRGSADDIYAEIVDGRIEGLIMTAPPEDPLAERLAASHLPVVVVADPVETLPSVVVDDFQGARLSFDYLTLRGHERFMYRSLERRVLSELRRRTAFMGVAQERDLHIVEWRGPDLPSIGEKMLAAWRDIPARKRPTAVLCWNDRAAYDLLLQCHRQGVLVPDDLAIVGFDGEFNPMAFQWRLTTVHAPWAEVGRTAVNRLIAQIERADNETDEEPQRIVLPVTFVPGDSA